MPRSPDPDTRPNTSRGRFIRDLYRPDRFPRNVAAKIRLPRPIVTTPPPPVYTQTDERLSPNSYAWMYSLDFCPRVFSSLNILDTCYAMEMWNLSCPPYAAGCNLSGPFSFVSRDVRRVYLFSKPFSTFPKSFFLRVRRDRPLCRCAGRDDGVREKVVR